MKVFGILLMVYMAVAQPHTFPDEAAIVNRPVTFPCNCSGHVVKWKIIHPTKESIAVCQHERCQIELRFQKRFSVLAKHSTENFSLSISSAVYNDVGYYECTCDERSVSGRKLQVYDPRVVKFVEGENITLPCYGDTRKDAKDAQWKKDGKKLLEYPYAITDEASTGRFTMSKEGYLDGDLSLHVTSVQLSDAGLYLCLIHGESRVGDPRAVLLMVEKHQPPTTPNSYIRQAITVTVTLVLVFLVIIGVIRYHVRRCRGPQDVTATNPRTPVQEEDSMIPKPSSTQPICD